MGNIKIKVNHPFPYFQHPVSNIFVYKSKFPEQSLYNLHINPAELVTILQYSTKPPLLNFQPPLFNVSINLQSLNDYYQTLQTDPIE